MDIFSHVIIWLVDSSQSVLGWLMDIWHACGNVVLTFLTFFIIFSVVRVLLIPLIGRSISSGQSDRVRSPDMRGSSWYQGPNYTPSSSHSSYHSTGGKFHPSTTSRPSSRYQGH